jgi:GntR family transcriptional regulator
MMTDKLERNLPVSDQLRDILRTRILDGVYPAGSKFPPESDLAGEFDVSRITVRRACNTLVSNGLLIRRWGVGTFVSKFARISNPINEIISFLELIRTAGYEPDVEVVSAKVISADEVMAGDLSVPVGSRLLRLDKTFTADGDPVILATAHIPEKVIANCLDEALAHPEITEPLMEFLADNCGRPVKGMVSEFWPDTLAGCGLEVDKFDPGTPVLVLNNVAYDNEEIPILLTNQVQIGNRMRYNLVRQRSVM